MFARSKYSFLFHAFLLGVLTSSAQWNKLDYPKKYNTVVKTNPFMVVWGILPFTSEYRFVREVATAKKQSLLFGFSVLGVSPVVKFAVNTGQGPYHPVIWIKGYRFQFMYKMYFSRDKEAEGAHPAFAFQKT